MFRDARKTGSNFGTNNRCLPSKALLLLRISEFSAHKE
jgi:hypothetical protein